MRLLLLLLLLKHLELLNLRDDRVELAAHHFALSLQFALRFLELVKGAAEFGKLLHHAALECLLVSVVVAGRTREHGGGGRGLVRGGVGEERRHGIRCGGAA